ncbi:MAG: ATP-binding protein [Bdellovibrionota bacterium]
MKFITKIKLFTVLIGILITYLLYLVNIHLASKSEILFLIAFVLYTLLVVILLCFDDIGKFKKQFANFIKTINTFTRKKEDVKYSTPIGKTLNEYLLFLERKVFLLKKDSEDYKNEDLNNPINFLKKMDINPEIDEQSFFQNILNILSGFYQKNAIVLFYYDKESGNCFSLSSLSSNKHVSMFLKQMFLNCIANEKEIKEGVVSYYNVSNVLEDLSLFGYQRAIIKKIKFSNDSNTIIYLWFGISGDDISFLKEENLFNNLSYEIGNQYETYLKLKSAKNEIEKKTKEAIKKSEYLEFVSHDLRSPLANLVAVLKLLEINSDEENKKEFIEIALNNCDSISLLLEDLLDFSKYKNSDLKVFKENVNVSDELKYAVNNFYLRASEKNLKINFKDNLKNKIIYADKRQFKKIINNIISNAIKYTEKGHIDIECTNAKNNIVIKISDTGIGIKKENLQEIFSSFKRGENAEHLDGYGLGLFMVKAFSDLNDITVSVVSTENKGSEFTLKMPFIKEKVSGINKLAIEDKKAKKIVLIDDDKELLESTKRLLEAYDFLVQSFFNIKDAKKFLLSNSVDLIISDYYIGKERVDTLLEFLKEKKISVDVFILTGKTNIDIDEYKKYGVKKIITKPLDIPLDIKEILES